LNAPLLSVRGLETRFGGITVLDKVSFDVGRSEFLGLVGESGSGKSITALSIMRLIDPPGRITGGDILFEGENIAAASERRMRDIRGRKIAMIFQEPLSSLNPMFTIGNQIAEAIRIHEPVSASAARRRAIELFDLVSIPSPAERVDEYPHRLSGGMRQRVMIAMALACNPALVIADEPTTALDVTVQAGILDLLRRLRTELGLSILFITHDLGVIAEVTDRVIVMYAGSILEVSETTALFESPAHPYTEGLMKSRPALFKRGEKLQAIAGVVPAPREVLPGCRFAPRCAYQRDVCLSGAPPLVPFGNGQEAACFGRGGGG
jgi:oligopeptide/dipeptide ABC transporter ATP-binding protein